MKLHDVKREVEAATGLTALDGDKAVEVLVTGDRPEMVEPTAAALRAAGIPFICPPAHKAFRGRLFRIPLKNIGTAWHADWEYDQ